jgi:cytochrome c oxidase subunit 2
VLGAGLLVLSAPLAACGGSETPPVPVGADGVADPVLETGRAVYMAQCAQCHGDDGKGRNGPVLAGRVADAYPDIDDQIDVVVGGRKAMPAFGVVLTPEEITAVVRFTREVL